jgi:hypothetical protein
VKRPDPESDHSIENAHTRRPTEHPRISFTLLIPAKRWEIIKPITKEYSRKRGGVRRLQVLKSYVWEKEIVEVLFGQHRITCPYAFQSSYVYLSQDSQQYVKMEAKCRESGATAVGKILIKPLK